MENDYFKIELRVRKNPDNELDELHNALIRRYIKYFKELEQQYIQHSGNVRKQGFEEGLHLIEPYDRIAKV